MGGPNHSFWNSTPHWRNGPKSLYLDGQDACSWNGMKTVYHNSKDHREQELAVGLNLQCLFYEKPNQCPASPSSSRKSNRGCTSQPFRFLLRCAPENEGGSQA